MLLSVLTVRYMGFSLFTMSTAVVDDNCSRLTCAPNASFVSPSCMVKSMAVDVSDSHALLHSSSDLNGGPPQPLMLNAVHFSPLK